MVCHSVEQKMGKSIKEHLVVRAMTLEKEAKRIVVAVWLTGQAMPFCTRYMVR